MAINYGAVGYGSIMYISEAMKNCDPGENECLWNALKDVKDYPTIIESRGFKDNVLQLTTHIYEYRNGKWVLLE